ncbi:MAG: PP0621 family protein [Betaproteobacteria bacterium]
MGKLILIVVVVVALLWVLRRALAGPNARAGKPPEQAGDAKGDLVSCAHCAVNLPKAEARNDGGRFYCSEEHWRLGPKDG